ncbi:hypothetical protein E6Q11_02990 [Candidatus Dojkabacteria bacterium]|uniref:Uncharacterized protein n=1 Tax=Candidatus Dojkabacteria bacterium TaxID=2099670 RepID=A0A5C7J729_9BACT|nr:MAG: hypothetical protein E6Q11_02990 [Candidatus Dojkabacteria bacterium]
MRIAETQLVRAVAELREKGQTSSELSRALMLFLQRKRLMKHAAKILRSLEEYTAQQAGLVRVEATSARPLSEAVKHQVQKKAEELFGGKDTKTAVHFREDPQLLGGVKLETNTTRYDFSLGRTLLDLHKSLVK